MELILSLHNIRSTYNVGAILRTAEGFGVDKVICSGWTPTPYTNLLEYGEFVRKNRILPHLADKLDNQIHKTSVGANEMIQIDWSDNIISDIKAFKESGYKIIGLENNIKDKRLINLTDFKSQDEKYLLILGEEVNGIEQDLYDLIDVFVEIPMKGRKESFNVSVAAGIAMYQITLS